MAHNINSMMYVGEKPWHGLGTKVEEAVTSAEAITLAGLDYSVEKKPIYINGGIEVPNHYATVRTDTNDALCFCWVSCFSYSCCSPRQILSSPTEVLCHSIVQVLLFTIHSNYCCPVLKSCRSCSPLTHSYREPVYHTGVLIRPFSCREVPKLTSYSERKYR